MRDEPRRDRSRSPDAKHRPIVINEHGLPESFGEGLTAGILFWIAVSFSTFQIITSFGIPLDAPFISSMTLNHFLAVAMAAWAAWLIRQAVRRRSVVDGALAWLAIAVAFGLSSSSAVAAEPGAARRPCRLPVLWSPAR